MFLSTFIHIFAQKFPFMNIISDWVRKDKPWVGVRRFEEDFLTTRTVAELDEYYDMMDDDLPEAYSLNLMYGALPLLLNFNFAGADADETDEPEMAVTAYFELDCIEEFDYDAVVDFLAERGFACHDVLFDVAGKIDNAEAKCFEFISAVEEYFMCKTCRK